MEFRFDNKDLEKLYTEGKSKKYRLPNDIIDKFFARIQQIEAANDIYDLWNDKGLNFEKLQGSDSRYSMRLKLKYRGVLRRAGRFYQRVLPGQGFTDVRKFFHR